MLFRMAGPLFCPKHPLKLTPKGRPLMPQLVCVRENYSGLGVDIAKCPECDATFQVTYKVESDEIQEIDDDGKPIKPKLPRARGSAAP